VVISDPSELGKMISDLAHTPNLDLTLVGPAIRDADLSVLSSFRTIRFLQVMGCSITDDALFHIANSPSLEILSTDSRLITARGIRSLRCLHSLRGLHLHRSATPSILDAIGNLDTLESLSIGPVEASLDHFQQSLSRLQSLKTLQLRVDWMSENPQTLSFEETSSISRVLPSTLLVFD
jgi:hypothetical protein